MNDKLASIFVDLAIRNSAPDPSRPLLLWVWLQMENPREDGLSTREEADALWKAEDSLVNGLESTVDALFVGRITTDGRREFYFYLAQRPTNHTKIASAVKLCLPYSCDWGTKHDPHWEQYLSLLFPTDEQLQAIKNRQVLEVLRKHGDTSGSSREVRHWVYFRKQSNRSQFATEAAKLGYVVESESESEQEAEERPFGICISRTDPVSPEGIDQTVLQLFRLAKSCDGEYDGWETELVAPVN